MELLETVAAMRHFVTECREQGKIIALVPTMGALHEGHLTLMRQAKQAADVVVASVFVNPTQFGPSEDFDQYPRDLASDSEKVATAGVDAIFHPTPQEMYPSGYATYVQVEGITNKLCGASRPGHFRGVATVVSKLFHIVQPDEAFFGQKDAQQVLVLRRMVEDLNIPVRINMVPIVRESDGLALSSRNRYLSVKERQAALCLSKALRQAKKLVAAGCRSSAEIKKTAENLIEAEPLATIDYVSLLHYPSLADVSEELPEKTLLAFAVKIGATRLIDNTILEAK